MKKQIPGIEIEILSPGKGDTVKKGDMLVMHYIGTLENGEKFDSSRDRAKPFHFTIGTGQVIVGWDEGIIGMKVGEKRKLTISPGKAYGEREVGSIPANSVLIFEVELLEIVNPPWLRK